MRRCGRLECIFAPPRLPSPRRPIPVAWPTTPVLPTPVPYTAGRPVCRLRRRRSTLETCPHDRCFAGGSTSGVPRICGRKRSEERRVGKERAAGGGGARGRESSQQRDGRQDGTIAARQEAGGGAGGE